MVATEERKIAARRAGARKEGEGDNRGNRQPKHKEVKDKIVSESKSAGK